MEILLKQLAVLNDRIEFSDDKSMFNPLDLFAEKVVAKEKTHSEILAELLNPHSNKHKQGVLFLQNFLKAIGIESDNHDYTKCRIDVEKHVKCTVKENRFIDIYISLTKDKNSPSEFGIIIENKLNGAPFQDQQLTDYVKAIEKEVKKVYVVCLYKNNETSRHEQVRNLKCECICISALDLAGILEQSSTTCSEKDLTDNLHSYISYLRNLHSINKHMDNAKVLFNAISEKDSVLTLPLIKALSEAYDLLPTQYRLRFEEYFEENNKLNGEDIQVANNGSYKSYIDVWQKSVYDKIHMWISVCPTEDGFKTYLVADNLKSGQIDNKLVEEADFDCESAAPGGGYIWYKPKEQNKFEYKFPNGHPDIEAFALIVMQRLKKLSEIASEIQ